MRGREQGPSAGEYPVGLAPSYRRPEPGLTSRWRSGRGSSRLRSPHTLQGAPCGCNQRIHRAAGHAHLQDKQRRKKSAPTLAWVPHPAHTPSRPAPHLSQDPAPRTLAFFSLSFPIHKTLLLLQTHAGPPNSKAFPSLH